MTMSRAGFFQLMLIDPGRKSGIGSSKVGKIKSSTLQAVCLLTYGKEE
jgi:hypothetical protein